MIAPQSLLSMFLLMSGMALPQAALQTVRVVSIPGKPLAVIVALRQGLFVKHGLNVEIGVAPTSNELRAVLASGKLDIAHAAVDNAVAMVEGGSNVVIVMGGETSANELIVQPGIRSIADLRGKTAIVDAPNTAYALQLKKILLSAGLVAGRDYEIKPIGTTPERLAAMLKDKQYAVSMLGPPQSLLAKDHGLVSLGSTNDLIGLYQASGVFVRRSWAREHSGELVRYIAAYVEAQRWLLAPENRTQVLELIENQWHLSQPLAVGVYAIMVHGWFEKDAAFDVKGFKNVLKLRAEVEHQWNGILPSEDKFVDLSFYKTAITRTSH